MLYAPLSNPKVWTRSAAASVALVAALACLAACSSNSSDQTQASVAGVVREGHTTDAALLQVLAIQADDWGWAGGVFDSPSDQSTFASDTPASFAWHADPTGDPPADVPLPSEQNGQAFFLVFKSAGGEELLRVFTSLNDYTPDASAWQTLLSTDEAMEVSLTSSTFANDKLTPEGGPHAGQTLKVRIGHVLSAPHYQPFVP
jgi:hypothetical protein